MKIGIDIRPLQWEHRYRGIGVYLANLLEALSNIDHQNQYILFAWQNGNPLKAVELNHHFNYQVVSLPKTSRSIIGQKVKNILSRDIKAKVSGLDVFLQPDAAFGIVKHVPSVVVAYDLIELLFREEHYPASFTKLLRKRGLKHALGNKLRWRLYKWQLRQFQSAKKIVAISQSTKKDLRQFFPRLAADKIKVIPLASSLKPLAPNEKGRKKPLSILYIGAADYRKNVIALVQAFEQLKPRLPQLKLNLAGKAFGQSGVHEHKQMWSLINNSKYKADIIVRDYVTQSKLTQLYQEASVFAFPSLYEGFGMPILEAMAAGCPVVAYRTSAIPEVAGHAALLVKPGEDLSKPLGQVLTDEVLRQKLILAGRARAKEFSWDNTAKMTLQVLKETAI